VKHERASLYVVTYDIANDNRRVKVANILKSYGERVQLSVFECWLSGSEFGRLKDKVRQQIELSVDSVRFYRPKGEVFVLGAGPVPQEPEFYLA